jgi:hypothetical protein
MLGGRRKGLPRSVRQLAFQKKNVPIQPWLTWLSLLPLAALEIMKIRSCETHEAGMSLSL